MSPTTMAIQNGTRDSLTSITQVGSRRIARHPWRLPRSSATPAVLVCSHKFSRQLVGRRTTGSPGAQSEGGTPAGTRALYSYPAT
jgi:hypothetical protein